MSLREKLTKPLVLEPTAQHTHTVIFLHLFEPNTDDDTLRAKVLAAKKTKDHRTLGEQFPTIRWVFPHPKNGSVLHWSNLSADEKRELELTMPGVPYITQIILQEADRAGGLDKIILGGQGKTAEAAHDAMSSFPEGPAATTTTATPTEPAELVTAHIQKYFHPTWTEVAQLKMAGFVGMHVPMNGPGAQITRDVRNFGLQSKIQQTGSAGINNAIVKNTPHKFIHGGYKTQTMTWDGRRIDDFATFLEGIGVTRILKVTTEEKQQPGNELLTPKDRSVAFVKRDDGKEELNEKQKYALEIVKQKAESERQKETILRRIEADKVERKIKQAREREARFYRTQAKQERGSQEEMNQLGQGYSPSLPDPDVAARKMD